MKKEIQEVLDTHSKRRPFRAAFYGCLFGAGAVLLLDPTRQLQLASPLVRWVWSGFLVLGGLFTIYGAARDHWRPEWIGIPMQGSAVTAFAAVLILGGSTTGRIAFSLFLVAIVMALISRFLELSRLADATSKMHKRLGVG